MLRDLDATGVLERIDALSSAEDIFGFLMLPYEQEVLDVSRLHIMKRFGAYLRELDPSEMDRETVFVEARRLLARAYADFVESTPLKEKVFKVFRDEEAKLKSRFVGLDAIRVAE